MPSTELVNSYKPIQLRQVWGCERICRPMTDSISHEGFIVASWHEFNVNNGDIKIAKDSAGITLLWKPCNVTDDINFVV